MKKSKLTDAQIAFVLCQAMERTAIGDACHKAGISEATFHNRRKRYGGLMPSEMRLLAQPGRIASISPRSCATGLRPPPDA